MKRSIALLMLISQFVLAVPTTEEAALADASPVAQTQHYVSEVPQINKSPSRGTSEPIKYHMTIESTAYTHTGYMTYTETWPKKGTIAVDPNVIPLGSEIWVEGYGWGKAEDTGGLIKGQIIDVFMETEQEALEWGRRQVRIIVIPPVPAEGEATK